MRDHRAVDGQQALVAIQQFLFSYRSDQISNIVLGITRYSIQIIRVLLSYLVGRFL